MELNDFIKHFSAQFEDVEPGIFEPGTKFKDIEDWSSLTALSIIAMVDEEFNVSIKGDDIINSLTINDLFNIVKSRY